MSCPISEKIFASVCESMQSAEDITGPEPANYADLMLRIATEALGRARRFAAAQDRTDLRDMAGYSVNMIEDFRADMVAASRRSLSARPAKVTLH